MATLARALSSGRLIQKSLHSICKLMMFCMLIGTIFCHRINQEFHNQTVFVRNETHFMMGECLGNICNSARYN